MIDNIVASEVIVYKTRDYSRFSFDPANRPIIQNHVAQMAEDMRANNWLVVCPIIVSSAYVVHDGQHRLEAAKQAEVEVYYIIADDVDIRAVAQMNRLTQSWTVYDWLNYWVVYGENENYILLQEYLEAFPLISLSAAMFICTNTRQFGLYKVFRQGMWQFGDTFVANEVGEIMNIVADKLGKKLNQSFSRAIKRIVEHPEYDGERMRQKLAQIDESPTKWIFNASTQDEAISLLQGIYNFNMRKDRIAFTRP